MAPLLQAARAQWKRGGWSPEEEEMEKDRVGHLFRSLPLPLSLSVSLSVCLGLGFKRAHECVWGHWLLRDMWSVAVLALTVVVLTNPRCLTETPEESPAPSLGNMHFVHRANTRPPRVENRAILQAITAALINRGCSEN